MKPSLRPHEPLEEMLSRFMDGDLSEGERRRVEQRLRDDPQAAAQLGALRKARRALRRAMSRDQLPSDLVARLRQIPRSGADAPGPEGGAL